MAFKQAEIDQLLADTGRRCCICGTLHGVQVHHIVPREDGGSDDIDNAISLCPNCHDEVHSGYASGRTTRAYTVNELKLHRKRTIEQTKREQTWTAGGPEWEEDKELVLFFAQCLDRPAFRTQFHQEVSFSAFDKAMEDTMVALNTGYWRMRDGTLIERARGKAYLVNPKWRQTIEKIVEGVESIRKRFQDAVGFNRMLYQMRSGRHHGMPDEIEELMERSFRGDRDLGEWMNTKRQDAIDLMNSLLEELGHQPLRGIDVQRWG